MNNNVVALSLDRVHKYYNTQAAKSDLSKFSTYSKIEEDDKNKLEEVNPEANDNLSEEELAQHVRESTLPNYVKINKDALSDNKVLSEFQYRSYIVPSAIKQDSY